jgi:BCD family chlorophyll transporter-like MFS transporter
MAALALGGVAAAAATALMGEQQALGLALGTAAFACIGAGVSATGTSLLVLMAKRVTPERKAAAATVVWMMMIAGLGVTASVAGKLLDPYSPTRLIAVAGGVSALALLLTLLAIWRVEGEDRLGETALDGAAREPEVPFLSALAQVWGEGDARRFTVFVFVSMLAYSAQDLILEPFAGSVFGFTPGRSTSLSGVQHGGTFSGMLLVAVATTLLRGTRGASLQGWVVGGCLASAAMMAGLTTAGLTGGPWPLEANVFLMGLANGAFSIAAIGSMMSLASQGRRAREGVRMGLWGAAQAIAFAAGGFLGTVLVDLARLAVGAGGGAYAFVFGLEGVAFLVSAWLALGVRFHAGAAGTG